MILIEFQQLSLPKFLFNKYWKTRGLYDLLCCFFFLVYIYFTMIYIFIYLYFVFIKKTFLSLSFSVGFVSPSTCLCCYPLSREGVCVCSFVGDIRLEWTGQVMRYAAVSIFGKKARKEQPKKPRPSGPFHPSIHSHPSIHPSILFWFIFFQEDFLPALLQLM